ncbi:hypothetical protein ACFFX1_32755 [Dactylosporangium sucinum]|uniref:Uncharacterized protein n=1 Tax=Dactylosporangium sucinum TaxID=1424081 RepID=A0A917T7U0_9ACTN|nr:hypothetical protein [Dactylosporangium sucinum]GGM12441.1 hypothetical protein GCM10007977_012050 [Dactylosporangium sucinum]
MALSPAARASLEEFMTTTSHGPKYHSDFARRYYGEGEAQGKAKGEARALLLVLKSRGVDVPDAVREQIAACTDHDQLDRWLERAATAHSIKDIDERFAG